MIKLAHILPNSYINKVPLELDCYLDMVLAHEVLENKEYTEIYLNRKKQGSYTILDNSAFEFGEAISLDLLNKAIELIAPDEFILPDSLFNKDKTIELTEQFLKDFSKKNYD